MTKLDLKKEFKHLYSPSSKEVALVDVPPLNFLMIDGSGDPNTAQPFQDAMQALYGVAYTLKFMLKGAGTDYTVMPLEGLWWAEDMRHFSVDAKGLWQWTVMIAQPDLVTAEHVREAIEQTRRKKNPAGLDRVRFETYHEGLSAQILHLGSYADEGPTMQRLHGWILANGYDYHDAGKHHEIYLSAPGRTAPENMRTVLRQPVRKVETGG